MVAVPLSDPPEHASEIPPAPEAFDVGEFARVHHLEDVSTSATYRFKFAELALSQPSFTVNTIARPDGTLSFRASCEYDDGSCDLWITKVEGGFTQVCLNDIFDWCVLARTVTKKEHSDAALVLKAKYGTPAKT